MARACGRLCAVHLGSWVPGGEAGESYSAVEQISWQNGLAAAVGLPGHACVDGTHLMTLSDVFSYLVSGGADRVVTPVYAGCRGW